MILFGNVCGVGGVVYFVYLEDEVFVDVEWEEMLILVFDGFFLIVELRWVFLLVLRK